MLEKVIKSLPKNVSLIVDISNVTDKQLSYVRHITPVLISTHKSFNYKHQTKKLPVLPNGTRWVVLTVPHKRDDGHTHKSTFDSYAGKFVAKRKVSPVRLSYHSNSKCSIERSTRHRTKTDTNKAHSWCEIDDLVIAQLCHTFDLPALTNDQGLRKMIERGERPRIPTEMRELMRHTGIRVLRCVDGRWS